MKTKLDELNDLLRSDPDKDFVTAVEGTASGDPNNIIMHAPARKKKEETYNGKTFSEIQAMDKLDVPVVVQEKTMVWRQQLRHLCDPRIITELLNSPITKDRMEALKFCAQYGYGMPDKIIAIAAVVREENKTELSDDVLRTAMATLATVVDTTAEVREEEEDEN